MLSASDHVAVAEYVTGRKLDDIEDRPLPRCRGAAAAFDYDAPPLLAGWGFQPTNSRYIDPQLGGVEARDLKNLKLKWTFAYPGAMKARSQPAVAAGALFVGSDRGDVYALDRRTGCVRWTFQASAEVRNGIVVASWSRADRSAKPLLYFGDVIGNLYAVNAIDGAISWKAHPDDHASATLTASPALSNGVLYVPVSSLEEEKEGDCCTFRGSMVAYDATSGRELWRTYMVAEEAKEIARFAGGQKLLGPSGVGLWNTPVIDAKRGLMYFGTGDNYTPPSTGMSDAIVALELTTGKIRWVSQVLTGDVWHIACLPPAKSTCLTPDAPDFDFGAASILATTQGGRDLVVSGQKSGWVYAMNPDDGSLVWKTRVGRGGISAGIYFGMSSHDGKVFVPIGDLPDGKTYEEPAQPGLYALDLETGEFLWRAPHPPSICDGRPQGCSPGVFAAATTVGKLLFTGGADGRVRAQSTSDGSTLWQFDTVQDLPAIGGGVARGGSIGTGVTVIDGTVIVNAGYAYGQITGNAMLVFEVDRTDVYGN
jgi:polyvinyl alcohol dehydrogenase (cytochrome)